MRKNDNNIYHSQGFNSFSHIKWKKKKKDGNVQAQKQWNKFKIKKKKKDSQCRVVLGLLFYECIFFFDGDFVAKGEGRDLLPSPFSKQFNLDHHNFVILSGLKAFRLQKTGIRVYILYIHTN